MATYLSGVTDYIPQFQPFEPDLNFYDNVLKTKQTQYDSNWKALNNMYSKYYYADLTRDNNIKARDSFVKDAEFNLKRISQLDLSLEQNVQQATQIFRPFYENTDLMKDMAWTKNKNTERARGESFRTAVDPEQNKKYWAEGIREIDYLTQEFKEASNEDALTFNNVTYTPNVDVMGRAQEIAKEFGDIQTVDFSGDKRWIIKTKNGEQLEEPLQKLFEARLGNDPSVQAYYRTKSFVNRKDYVESNAAQFNGDKTAAEMKYLQDQYTTMRTRNEAAYKQLQEQTTVYDNKIKDIQKQIDSGNKDPRLQKSLDAYVMNKQINDQVLERVKKENELMATNQTNNPNNPYGDLRSFRYKVDAGVAGSLMEKELGEAAHVYAFRNYMQDVDANPYQVNAEKHAQNMSLLNARLQGERKLAEYKAGLKSKLDANKSKVDAGTHYYNDKGELVERFDMSHFFTEVLDAGNTTGKVNLRAENEYVQQKYTQNFAVPYFQTMMKVLKTATDPNTGKQLTQRQINYIINGNENKAVDLNRWATQIQQNPNSFLVDKVGQKWMQAINYRFKNFVQANPELTSVKNAGEALATSTTKFDDYLLFLGESKKFETKLSAGVEKELGKQGFKYAKYLYDEDGNIRTKEQFLKALPKNANLDADGKTKGTPLYVSTGSPLTMGTSGDTYVSMPKNYYEQLTGAASKIVGNAAITSKITGRNTVPGLEKLSDGSGLFSKAQFTVVNPKSSWGTYHYGQVLNNLRSQDLGAAKISVGGISVTGAKSAITDEAARAFLTELQREMDKGTKGFNFKMGVAPIALNNAGKSAYIFQVPPELIDKLTGKMVDDQLVGGFLSPSQAKEAKLNGISFIMDRKNFDSDMYNSMFIDPLAAYVDNDNTYSWKHPLDDRYSINISSSQIGGDGSYQMDWTIPVFDQTSNKWIDASYSSIVDNAKQNLSELRDNIISGGINQGMQINNQLVYGN
jgi:hypothetical protein